MAWSDQCKIAAVQTIKKVSEDTGLSVRKAIAEVSREADIPAATLERWFYPREQKSYVKNDVTYQRERNEDSIPLTVESIRERRIRAAIIHATYALLEEKCLKGCSIDPELCVIRKYLDFMGERP